MTHINNPMIVDLHDLYAAAALVGILAHTLRPSSRGNEDPEWSTTRLSSPREAAAQAWEYAEAMMNERKEYVT